MPTHHPPTTASTFALNLGARAAAKLSLIILPIVLLVAGGQAQTFTVLHSFTGGADGASPFSSLAIDHYDNLYGAATFGGAHEFCTSSFGVGCGAIFKMTHRGSGWTFATLYEFGGHPFDGANPVGTPTLAPDGTIYGTTDSGGIGGCSDLGGGCGTIFRLQPRPTICPSLSCPWTETILYSFMERGDGGNPTGAMAMDAAGILYGTTLTGNETDDVVFEAGAMGYYQVLHTFTGYPTDGSYAYAGPTIDSGGNLYGTTVQGGSNGGGTVYQLKHSGSGWNESVIYNFEGGANGASPAAGLVLDPSGNLYGITQTNPFHVIFSLTPMNGGWNFTNLYSFPGDGQNHLLYSNTLARDASGNLYGTDNNGEGSVFELSPAGGGWNYTQLYQFTGGSDGGNPGGGVVLDSVGNLYGTTTTGGAQGHGTVWEITP